MVSMWFALHFVVQEVVGCEFPIQSSLQKQELLGKIVARTRGGTALSGVATTTLGSHIPSNTSMAMYAHHGPMMLLASKQAVNQLLHDAAIQACMENWGSNAKSCSMVPGSPAGAAPAGAAVCRSCTVTFSCHRTGSILK